MLLNFFHCCDKNGVFVVSHEMPFHQNNFQTSLSKFFNFIKSFFWRSNKNDEKITFAIPQSNLRRPSRFLRWTFFRHGSLKIWPRRLEPLRNRETTSESKSQTTQILFNKTPLTTVIQNKFEKASRTTNYNVYPNDSVARSGHDDVFSIPLLMLRTSHAKDLRRRNGSSWNCFVQFLFLKSTHDFKQLRLKTKLVIYKRSLRTV
jgi:hypothetical protein